MGRGRDDQAASVGSAAPADDEPALAGFVHDVDVTRFDSRFGRPVLLALAAAIAAIAYVVDARTALVVGVGVALVLAVTTVALERERWRAQDVFQWYQRGRRDSWWRDTGSVSPGGDPAAAEIWLGAHQPGTVPQRYRALAAVQTGDPVVIRRETAALPEDSVLDQAWKEWVLQTARFNSTGSAVPERLAGLVDSLPPSPDRSGFQVWVAMVRAARGRRAGDPGWIRTLADERTRAVRTPLGIRRQARIWLSRFAPVIVFAIPAVLLSTIAVGFASLGEPIPSEYGLTTYSTRGDLPHFDEAAVARSLPALARAIPTATRVGAGALDVPAYNHLVDVGQPTFTWTTSQLDLAPPTELRGHRVFSVEVLLGGSGDAASTAIVIIDSDDGPAYLYRLDPTVVGRIRGAAGLEAASHPP